METGFKGATPEMKAYDLLHKMEEFGERTGLVVNRKVTKLGVVAIGVSTVVVFGGLALVKAFIKSAMKK